MAKPARRFDDDEARGNADSEPSRPHLRKLEGGGDTSEPDRSWYHSDKDHSDTDHEDLADAEDKPGSASFYSSGKSSDSGGLTSLANWAKKRRKRVLIAL